MRIAIDAMGGDKAPAEIVLGAYKASIAFDCEILLVGNPTQIKRYLPSQYPKDKIHIVEAADQIEMDEDPVMSVRKKKDCSINVAVRLVKENKADAFLSAGNTGACMASALLGLGRIEGIERPAIATVFPTVSSKVVLLDMGANVDCKPNYLFQFAQMGAIYAEKALGISSPRISLLSIGEEEEKGNSLTFETNLLLKKSRLNYTGNVEGRHILFDQTDVVVCDGFVGNVVLKLSQGVAKFMLTLFQNELKKHWISWLSLPFLWPVIRSVRKKIDYSEYGAAPLLGVQGVCMIAHGRADAKSIKSAVKATLQYAQSGVLDQIKHDVKPIEDIPK